MHAPVISEEIEGEIAPLTPCAEPPKSNASALPVAGLSRKTLGGRPAEPSHSAAHKHTPGQPSTARRRRKTVSLMLVIERVYSAKRDHPQSAWRALQGYEIAHLLGELHPRRVVTIDAAAGFEGVTHDWPSVTRLAVYLWRLRPYHDDPAKLTTLVAILPG